MRSWLFSSAVFTLLLVFGCCGQKSKSDGTGTADPARVMGDTTGRHEAPKHNAPDQELIDSLKREKQKDK